MGQYVLSWLAVGCMVAYASGTYRRVKLRDKYGSCHESLPLSILVIGTALVVVLWPLEAALFLKDVLKG